MNIDDLISAFDDVAEARENLKQMQSEYTGYSPSYALSSWHEACTKAKEKLVVALNAYIDERVKECLQKEEIQ